MNQNALTKRQQQVYRFILGHCQQHGTGPTLRELSDAIGATSPNAVAWHLRALEREGLIVRGGKHKSRTIRPTCAYTVKAMKRSN